jgi:hypothetical protein
VSPRRQMFDGFLFRPTILKRVRGYEVLFYEIRVYNPLRNFLIFTGRASERRSASLRPSGLHHVPAPKV